MRTLKTPHRTQPYEDRIEAAEELAIAVEFHFSQPVSGERVHPGRIPAPANRPRLVVGLSRGGIPLSMRLARRLNLPWDFLVVQKIASESNPELAWGALAETGEEPAAFYNPQLEHPGLSRRELVAEASARAKEELERKTKQYRALHSAHNVFNDHVLLVDDGAATGATMRAAIRAMRKKGARRVSVALPVAPEETVAEIGKEADALICPWRPACFVSVGTHFRHFPQVTEAEVVDALQNPLETE
jgi:putative phosphoribosyl transferase